MIARKTRIGILGASGDIGHLATAALLRIIGTSPHAGRVVLGARRPDRIRISADVQNAAPGIELTRGRIDVRDPNELAEFADGLDLVINATGPSHDRAALTASVIAGAGAHYVDIGGPADARTLTDSPETDRTVLFYAGALPGAAGILPRWLLARHQHPRTLRVITGGQDTFTRSGAEDYLAGIEHGDVEPLAAWRNGGKDTDGALRQDQVIIDGFPEPVSLFPYLDTDSETIARDNALTTATWYSAMVGDGIMDALMLATGMGARAGGAWLRDASHAMAAGRRPYVLIIAETEDEKAMLRAPSEAVLAAEVAAATAAEILSGRVARGTATTASAVQPDRMLDAITGAATSCTLATSSRSEPTIMEEGAL